MEINDYFDNIYLLNLKRRKDRLGKSIKKLNQVNLNFEVFNGTDGQVLKYFVNTIDNKYFKNSSYLGCSISHLSIYNHALQSGYNRILIIEDDNLVYKNIQETFRNLKIPDWKDLFYLGYIPLSDDCSMWTYHITMLNDQILSDKIFRCHNLWGLFSYGITSSLMKEVLEVYNSEFPMEIDRYFVENVQKRGQSIAISPQLFCCDSGEYSDNQESVTASSITVKSIDSRFANHDDYF